MEKGEYEELPKSPPRAPVAQSKVRALAGHRDIVIAYDPELIRIVECYSKYKEHGQTMVMIIMSHGMKFLSDDVIFPSDFRMSKPSELFHRGIPLTWIVSRFSDENCPSLENKPKVFIAQTCRIVNRCRYRGPPVIGGPGGSSKYPPPSPPVSPASEANDATTLQGWVKTPSPTNPPGQ
ncbi:unnamed protein product [Cyprideis torosa]|uniref:Uncharacterized protein n=1 Tax=Cyprideis torosa TaxID=163714 RepID=A0A7R8ZT00_9CRUS|nr:unnamed protein product [Cyprideis torosa]CAG0902841.1 unnamed protein product [Cyprideis torosa]